MSIDPPEQRDFKRLVNTEFTPAKIAPWEEPTVMAAQIDGQPISFQDMIGTITLLILGGLETTSGVLGAAMIRFYEHPEILAQLYDLKLKPGADIEFHTSSNRAPESVPITFTPGRREA